MASNKKVLFMLSSHEQLGTTGRKTGWFLAEAAHPHHVLTSKGFKVEFASTAGGKAPLDESSKAENWLKDEINYKFLHDATIQAAISNTRKASQIDAKDYAAILYVGGHGTVWDFPSDQGSVRLGESVSKLIVFFGYSFYFIIFFEDAEVWKNGGVVAAVCHGPAGLVNLRDEKGEYIVKGKNVAGFSNEEEEAVGLTGQVPFSLEDRLKANGAKYSSLPAWTPYVQVDGRLVTGQNPQSATKVGEEIAKLLA